MFTTMSDNIGAPQIPAQEIAGVWVLLGDRRHMRSFLKEEEFPLSLER